MSLINKMLQDLDARGTPAGDAFPAQIKPVEREAYRPNVRVIAACVGGALAGLALTGVLWSQYRHRIAAPPALPALPVLVAVKSPAPAPAPLPAPTPAPVVAAVPLAPVLEAKPGSAADADAPMAVEAAPAEAAQAETVSERQRKRQRRAELRAERRAERAAQKEKLEQKAHAGQGKHARAADSDAKLGTPKSVAPLEPDGAEARAVREALARELGARGALPKTRRTGVSSAVPSTIASAVPTPTAARSPARGRDGTSAPNTGARAEAEYRRALASLQDGRMGDTIGALESALKIDPAHEAARQTLVGLLVEAGRGDEAVRQLQVGLTLDARQPALAMLLARLQIERGGNGIDTLTRTLPYAGNNPDYRAFLAGALQRQGRHREAADQYQAALRGVPGNGVWWMGLGMSLQAEKRNGEALDAFQKARAAGLPSQELQGFVERHVQQLGR